MPRLAFKPDASFFRKIALGAVGARAVASDLEERGHRIVELERGSTDTKLWKEVKRKRVRIPDLVCTRCGVRIESRAKTKAELSMSHSPTDAERSWDFGMVRSDWIAFPVCKPVAEAYWSNGRLNEDASYWRERNWVRWEAEGRINYFTVSAFKKVAPDRKSTKGVTEASETTIGWRATFSSRDGNVEPAEGAKVKVRRHSDGHVHTWTVRKGHRVQVSAGDEVRINQLLAAAVRATPDKDLKCSGSLPKGHLSKLIASRERTQRFTGVKLARMLKDKALAKDIRELSSDPEEDVYIRLEGASYLCAVAGESPDKAFRPFLEDGVEPETRLEAVIAVGETGTAEAVAMLSTLLDGADTPYYLRSAAAWSLGRIGDEPSRERLVKAFADVDRKIREEALEGLVSLGGDALPSLLEGIREENDDIAAGCAETLRQYGRLPDGMVDDLMKQADGKNPPKWAVWLLGHLPRQNVAAGVATLQERRPDLHYAITLLWSFVESWISRNWELRPGPQVSEKGGVYES